MHDNQKEPSPVRQWSPPFGAVVLLLFLCSGFAGLVYEVLWSRMLTYLFGATVYGVSTVLAAFMGGLALGSFLFGRWVDRRRNPLRIYAVCELGIAASALAVPAMLRLADPIYSGLYKSGEPSFAAVTFVRLILTLAVLLIPTTLMGATLPVLSRWYARAGNRLGLSLGTLYAINTFGAVAGCYVTGFHGIEEIGVAGMMYVAVAINAAVGLLALALSSLRGAVVEPLATEAVALPLTPSRWEGRSASEPALDELPTDITPSTAQMVFWFYGISGAIALAYQVAWSRSLSFSFDVLKNTTYAFTAMLTVFLIGLALGSALMTVFADRLPEPVRCFSLIQLGIGLTGAFSLIVIQKVAPGLVVFKELSDDQTEIYFAAAVANIFIKTGAAMFLPTFLMGMAYPVAARICVPSLAMVGRTIGDLYSINTVGAIIGALAAGFVLIPALHIPWTIFLLSLGNLAMAVIVTTNLTGLDPRRRYFVIGLAVICGIVLLVRFPFEAILHRVNPEEVRSVRYKEGALATVSAVENPLHEWMLYIDNVGVAGTDRVLLTDQKSLAHIPMLFLDKPATALTVGFGCGGASYSYLRYSALAKLDCVEICPTVLDFAPLFGVANKGQVLRFSPDGRLEPFDPRYSIIIDDIRSYLRFNPKRYDIIASDCTDLRYKTNANLYDLEYFQLCRDRITSGGMVVVWMPLGGLSTDTLRMALRTFQKVFPDFSLWYMNNEATHYALLIGTEKPLQINYRRMVEKLKEKSVSDDLAELCLNDADKLLSCYVTDGDVLEKELEGALVNSENRPHLEFLVPRYGYSEEPLYSNLDWLFSRAGSIERYLEPGSYTPDDLAHIRKYRAAVRWIVEGHKAYRRVKPDLAVRDYLHALETCPEDRATSRLLDFPNIQAREQLLPNDFWSRYWLGQVLSVQKDRDAEAISHLEDALRVARNRRDDLFRRGAAAAAHDAARLLKQIYERKGMKRELEQLAELVKDLPTTMPAQSLSP